MLCALSGGRDSMCFHILLELAPEYGFSVACAHYNHRVKGLGTDRDARFAEEYCTRLGIPIYLGSGDVAALPGKRAGRGGGGQKTRYAFLERTADEIGAQKLPPPITPRITRRLCC